MAFDERDSILKRRGWNPKKLTGMRRPAKFDNEPIIYNPKEFRKIPGYKPTDVAPEISEKTRRDIFWSVAIIAFWFVVFLAWRILR